MLKRILLLLLLIAVPVVMTAQVSAIDVFPTCQSTAKDSAVCRDSKPKGNPLFGKDGIITAIANFLSVVVGIISVIVIVLAGLRYVTSSNNPQEISSSRERIIYAIVALVVVGLAQVLVRFVISEIIT